MVHTRGGALIEAVKTAPGGQADSATHNIHNYPYYTLWATVANPADDAGPGRWLFEHAPAVAARVRQVLSKGRVCRLTFRSCPDFSLDFLEEALRPAWEADATPNDVVLFDDLGIHEARLRLGLERVAARCGKAPIPGYTWAPDPPCPPGVYDRLCRCPACDARTMKHLKPCLVCGDVNPELARSPRCGACGVPHGEGVDQFHGEVKRIIEHAREAVDAAAPFTVPDMSRTLLDAARAVYGPGSLGYCAWDPYDLVAQLLTAHHVRPVLAPCRDVDPDDDEDCEDLLHALLEDGPKHGLLDALDDTLAAIGRWDLHPGQFPYMQMADDGRDDPNA